jgi:hypothetical protein
VRLDTERDAFSLFLWDPPFGKPCSRKLRAVLGVARQRTEVAYGGAIVKPGGGLDDEGIGSQTVRQREAVVDDGDQMFVEECRTETVRRGRAFVLKECTGFRGDRMDERSSDHGNRPWVAALLGRIQHETKGVFAA